MEDNNDGIVELYVCFPIDSQYVIGLGAYVWFLNRLSYRVTMIMGWTLYYHISKLSKESQTHGPLYFFFLEKLPSAGCLFSPVMLC